MASDHGTESSSTKGQRQDSFVCGYGERRPNSPWAKGGVSWPLGRVRVEDDRLVMEPRGLLRRAATTILSFEDIGRIEEKRVWKIAGFRLHPSGRDPTRGLVIVVLTVPQSSRMKNALLERGLETKFQPV